MSAPGRTLTASDPEPPPGTLVLDDCGQEWFNDGHRPCCWVMPDADIHDPESWRKIAGNYGPVTVLEWGATVSDVDERQAKVEARAKAHAEWTTAASAAENLRAQVREALRAAGQPDDLLDRYDAARAHEAGAKIRRHAEGPCMYVPEVEQVWWATVHRVADLIDPDGAE